LSGRPDAVWIAALRRTIRLQYRRRPKELKMVTLNIIAIEQEARRLRAEDLRRGEPVFAERMLVCLHPFHAGLASLAALLGRALRPLFSSNPRARRPHLS
jgi:hypothetical protein